MFKPKYPPHDFNADFHSREALSAKNIDILC